MPIAATDLIAYEALNRPDDDVTLTGGGIDIDHRTVFTQMTANSNLEVVSSNAGDTTQSFTVKGRNAAGVIVTGTGTLNGTTAVAVPNGPYERILRFFIGADATGTVTLRNTAAGTTWGTVPPAERGFHSAFYDSASEAAIAIRFHKVHWRNSHATLTGTNAKVRLSADPDARIRQAIETAKGDTTTIANRKTTPAGVTFVDDNVDQTVPTGNLAAGENIGVWYEQNLPASDTVHRTTYTSQLTVTTV